MVNHYNGGFIPNFKAPYSSYQFQHGMHFYFGETIYNTHTYMYAYKHIYTLGSMKQYNL